MLIASLNCENISNRRMKETENGFWDDGYVSRIIRLTLLSPEIIHAIIAGTLEKDIGIEQLKQAMPLMWNEQKQMFGME